MAQLTRENLKERFLSRQIGANEASKILANITDKQINKIADSFFLSGEYKPNGICLVATGGYGRHELAPYSDIDLLFIYDKSNAQKTTEKFAETVLYPLWDLKLKVGHAILNVKDVQNMARSNLSSHTAFLDARAIYGDRATFSRMQKELEEIRTKDGVAAFIEAKLTERNNRHIKLGDSRYFLEPNIKEGKGGIRDLQTLYWILKYAYPTSSIEDIVKQKLLFSDEAKLFHKCHNFLLRLRFNLHYAAMRGEERLTFDIQKQIASCMNFRGNDEENEPVNRLMQRYFLCTRDIANLTRSVCSMLESQGLRDVKHNIPKALPTIGKFPIISGRIALGANFSDIEMMMIFEVAEKNNIDIHPSALRTINRNLNRIKFLRKNDQAINSFLNILTGQKRPADTLRLMNETGVIAAFIPEFRNIVCKMQYDRFHAFTADEHTFTAINVIHLIKNCALSEEHPLATQIIDCIDDYKVLMLAMLLHDIGKGSEEGQTHAGKKLAEKIAQRLNLNIEDSSFIGWLAENHLLMSDTAFRRDLDDPETIRDFIAHFKNQRNLDYLFMITVADIKAVGPSVWNEWKASLLRKLYWESEKMMSEGGKNLGSKALIRTIKYDIAKQLSEFDADKITELLAATPENLLLSFSPEKAAIAIRMLDKINSGEAKIDIKFSERDKLATEVFISCQDREGLFSDLTAIIAINSANILSAKAFTTANGIIIDYFLIQDASSKSFSDIQKAERITQMIEDMIEGKINPSKMIESYDGGIFKTNINHTNIKNKISITRKDDYIIAEISGEDKVGFLHSCAERINNAGFNILTAHISTHGNLAIDVFYITPKTPENIEEKISSLA